MTQVTFSIFQPVPEGTYRVLAKSVTERKSQNGPNPNQPFLAWDLEVQSPLPYKGRKISFLMGYQFGPNAMGAKFLKALGFVPPTDPGDYHLIPENYLNRECFVTVKVVKGKNGSESNKIESITSLQDAQTMFQGVTQTPPSPVQPPVNYPPQPPVNYPPQPPVNYPPQPPVNYPPVQPPVQPPVNYPPQQQQQQYVPGGGQVSYEPIAPSTNDTQPPVTRPVGAPNNPQIQPNPTIVQPQQPPVNYPGQPNHLQGPPTPIINDADDMAFPKG